MARVLLYKPLHAAGAAGALAVPQATPGQLKSDDGYTDKLLKYIPAEAIAFYTPLALVVKDSGAASQIILLLIGAVGVLLYVGYNARAQGGNGRVLPHYFALSVVGFVIWATNTNTQLGDLLHLASVWRTIALAAAVFLFPAADDWFALRGW